MSQNALSRSTVEKIGYYVYLLTDPRTDKIFYVGKGCGNRINHHLLGALEDSSTETEKVKKIRDIQNAGCDVGHTILRHGLTEKEAFEVESATIDLIGIDTLTNVVHGHHSFDRGRMTLADIKIEYEAEDAVLEEPVMLIRINKLYRHDMPSQELYEATHQHWKAALSRARTYQTVCAVYRGIVREVYSVQEWLPSDHMSGRIMFNGTIAPEHLRRKYLHRSVAHIWRHGSQNPIKYAG